MSVFRSNIFTIATNRVMAPVIHRTKPSTVSCHSGTDTPLGRRSLVIVRECPQTITCTYTHRRTYTAVLCAGTLQGRELLCIVHPITMADYQIQSESVYNSCCTMEMMKINLYLVIFNDLKKICNTLSLIRKVEELTGNYTTYYSELFQVF